MKSFSVLLALCEGNSPITGENPSQRPVTQSFAVFFYLGLKQQLSKPWRRRWFETLSRSLWHHYTEKFRWLPLRGRQREQLWSYFNTFFFQFFLIFLSERDRGILGDIHWLSKIGMSNQQAEFSNKVLCCHSCYKIIDYFMACYQYDFHSRQILRARKLIMVPVKVIAILHNMRGIKAVFPIIICMRKSL